MIPYYQLSVTTHGIYGMCLTSLLVVAVLILVTVYTLHMERRYQCFAAISVFALLFVLQGVDDVWIQWEKGQPFTFFAKIIGNLPYVSIILFMLFILASQVLFFLFFLPKKKHMLTSNAIKESLDALPDGICFFAEDGQPLLVNTQMNHISSSLFDSEILNVETFWKRLIGGQKTSATWLIRTEPTVLICTEDDKVWDVRRNILTIGHSRIWELVAYDVTRQYQLSRELEKRNKSLASINERLRQYSRQVEQITTENEILNAKIQVHDDVGRSLLGFRSYLTQSKEERDREELLFLWRYTIAVLKNEVAPVREKNRMELLLKAAQAVNVEVVQKGELPKEEKERDILIEALYECLTNTVKHANGNRLYYFITSQDTMLLTEFTNNGKPPVGKIQETGGLKNLRHTIEAAGGIMMIETSPRFVLRVALPNKEMDSDDKNKCDDCR